MGCTDCFKNMSAYRLIMIVNWIIFGFGLIMMIFGIVQLVNFSDDNFFTQNVYVFMILFGLATFGLVALAYVGASDPKEKPNYLFCYWLLVTVLLVGNIAGLYALRTFTTSLERASGSEDDGSVLSVIETQFAKEANDFMLSVYTTCCTGCDQAIAPACAQDFSANDFGAEDFCATVIERDELNLVQLADGECFHADVCSDAELQAQFEQDGVSDGLGLGCFLTLQEIPGFDIGINTCNVFASLSGNGFDLVGPQDEGGCGGGEPDVFVENAVDYFDSNYLRLAIPWGIFISLLAIAWIASIVMILFHSAGRDRKDYK